MDMKIDRMFEHSDMSFIDLMITYLRVIKLNTK